MHKLHGKLYTCQNTDPNCKKNACAPLAVSEMSCWWKAFEWIDLALDNEVPLFVEKRQKAHGSQRPFFCLLKASWLILRHFWEWQHWHSPVARLVAKQLGTFCVWHASVNAFWKLIGLNLFFFKQAVKGGALCGGLRSLQQCFCLPCLKIHPLYTLLFAFFFRLQLQLFCTIWEVDMFYRQMAAGTFTFPMWTPIGKMVPSYSL